MAEVAAGLLTVGGAFLGAAIYYLNSPFDTPWGTF